MNKNPTRFVYASDLHGDRQNEEAVKVLLAFTKEYKPHIKVWGGDLFDFRPLRRGATEEEKQVRMETDWQCGIDFLHAFKPTHCLLGNHDQRLYNIAESKTCGIKAAFAQNLCMEIESHARKLKCDLRPYHITKGVLRFGNLHMLHGFYHGENAAKRHVAKFESCIFGHVHAFTSVTEGTVRGHHIARSSGALCELIQDYNQTQPNTLRHEHGFFCGQLYEDGSFNVQEVRRANGQWHVPTSFKSF